VNKPRSGSATFAELLDKKDGYRRRSDKSRKPADQEANSRFSAPTWT
jgi:hypothetical protein